MKMKTLIFACAAGALAAANAGTVAWYSMNGTVGTRSVYTEPVPNRANPGTLDLIPGSIWSSTPIIGDGYNDDQKNVRAPIYTNAFPSAWSLYDPVSGASFTNETAFAFRNGDQTAAGSFAYVENDAALHLSSFTVEFFVKFPAGYSGVYNALAVMPAFMPCRNADAWGVRVTGTTTLQARFTPPQEEIAPNSTLTGNVEMSATIGNLFDGLWHHVALTFDDSSKTAKLYYDYELKFTKVLTFTPWYTDNPDCRLSLGASVETQQNSVCDMDEFRLSDTALPVDQFLRFRAADRSLVRPDTAFCFAMDCEKPWFGSTNRVNNIVDGASFFGMKSFKMLSGDVESMTASSAVPAATLHPSITSDVSCTNAVSTYNTYEGSAGGSYISVADATDMFRTNSFTVECFFKGDGNINTWTPLLRRPGGRNVQMNLGFGTPSGVLSQTLLDEDESSTSTFTGAESMNDGKWHHAALVVDQARKLALLYCDYQLLRSGSIKGNLCVKKGDIWIGGASTATFKGWLDTFRVSLSALRPSEFVTSAHVSGATLGWARYETPGVVDSAAPMMSLTGGTCVAGDGGAAPAVTQATVPKRFLADGVAAQTSLANDGSLSFANGYVEYPENPVLGIFADESLTVEFFMKAAVQPINTPYVRSRSRLDAGSDPIFALTAGTTSRLTQIRVLFRRTSDWSTVPLGTSINLTLCDEKWHHVALSLARQDFTNTVVTVYKDYEPAFTTNLPGIVSLETGKGNVVFGGLAGNGLCYTGLMDELRITRGELDASEFLRGCGMKGMYFIVR